MSVHALTEHPRYAPAEVVGLVDRVTLSKMLAMRGLPCSRAQVEKWKAAKMPHEKNSPGRPTRFDPEAVLAWLEGQGYDVSRLVQPAQREAN